MPAPSPPDRVIDPPRLSAAQARGLAALRDRAIEHEFARRLARPARNTAERADKPARTESSAEIDAWLAVFDPGRK